MTYYVNHTPYIVSLRNDKKARTIRLGFDDPQPIHISIGYENTLYFQLQDESNATVNLSGMNLTAVVSTYNGIKILEKKLTEYSANTEIMVLSINKYESEILESGLFRMDIIIKHDTGLEEVARSLRGRQGFVLNVA